MTQQDESAFADADQPVSATPPASPSRRQRRDRERAQELRALYESTPEPGSSVRVADGGAPIFRTRREMREAASQLARDLPVIVVPVVEQTSAVAEPQTAPQPQTAAAAPSSRRARRLEADAAVDRPVAFDVIVPELRMASSPAVVEPTSHVAAAASVPAAEPALRAAASRRARRAAERTSETASEIAPTADSWAAIAAASAVAASATVEPAADAPVLRDVLAAIEVPTEVEPRDAAAAAPVAASTVGERHHVMTRAERRAAAAAASAEVSAVVAAVLGEAQADAASTPVRSPLRREARAPRPAVIARRPIARQAAPARPTTRARTSATRRALQRLGAAGVILSIGSFVAVTSLPAQAFVPEAQQSLSDGAYGDVQVEQELDVTSGGGAHGDEEITAVLDRGDFSVDDAVASTTLSDDEIAALQVVADADEIGPYYDGEPSMPGVWSQLQTSFTQSPFPSLPEVPVSSGFGYRWGSFHGGVDLIPGAGTPVYPIANGVVVAVWQGNNPGGGGYEVIVEHNIDGQFFQSWYPHMQAGSIAVEEGQVVGIQTQLGAVGSTGRSTGAHLHLEIKNDEYVSVDPLVWLSTREQILEPS